MPDTTSTASETGEPDYDGLLRANLERVFNERNASKRAEAIDELFVAEPVMYEPTNAVSGRAAISGVAGKLLEQFGPTFAFVPEGIASDITASASCHGTPARKMGRSLNRRDVAEIIEGKIARLWVMLNPPIA